MHTIHKFPISYLHDVVQISMPEDAQILTAQVQNGVLCVWAKIDTEKPKVIHVFNIHGTGNPIEPGETDQYVGTVQKDGFVWHVFHKEPE